MKKENRQAFSESAISGTTQLRWLIIGTLHLHFSDVSISELAALVHEGRVVAHNVVDGDAGWEGNATLHLLALLAGESLLDFLLDVVIDLTADGSNVSTWNGEFLSLLQRGY